MSEQIKLTPSDLRGMADSCDDVADDVTAAGTALSDGETPDLPGFAIVGALADAAERWRDDKVVKAAGDWTTHAGNLRETADNFVGTDEKNEWHVRAAAPGN